jgi:hypothetical protein
MTHPLDGCRAKLNRAIELTTELEDKLRQFLSANPKPYNVKGEHRNEDREFHLVVSGPQPPLIFSVLAGEIIHHLRSALDHAIWAIATCKMSSPSESSPSERLQFPICDSKMGFEKSISNGVIKGVGDEAAKIVESVQPFKQPIPRDTVLSALNKASNTDKHRLLLVVGAVAQLGNKITVGDATDRKDGFPKETAIVGISPPKRVKIASEGTSAFAINFSDPAPQVSARADFDVSIAFYELGEARNVELIKGLRGLHAGTAHTVELFAKLFQ